MTGVVTRIVREQENRRDRGGYFFIRDEQGNDRFAHANSVGHDAYVQLKEGDRVEFTPLDPQPGTNVKGNGYRAEQVRIVR